MQISSMSNLRTRSCGGLIWLKNSPDQDEGFKEMPFLFFRGPQTCRYLVRGDNEPGIVAWSLDHHVLSVPVYRGPSDDGSIYQYHRAMLDNYRDFSRPQINTASDASSHLGGSDVFIPPCAKGALDTFNKTPSTSESFMNNWWSVHEPWHCAPVNLEYGWMHYEKNLTGNIVRATEADHHRGSVDCEAPPGHHIREQVIAKHLHQLDADHSRIVNSYPPGTMPLERKEVFAAWDEAVQARQATADRDGWNVKYLINRVPHNAAYFSVEGAIMVTIPVSVGDLPSEVSDISHNLAFFEPPDFQPSDDSGTIELKLPLLLIKEQPQSDEDDDDGHDGGNGDDGSEDEDEDEEGEDVDEDEDEANEPKDGDENENPLQHSIINVQRIATASAAWYLAHLGIKDFPVFGLVTCGKKGYLSQAWVSARDECCYVADWNIQTNPFEIKTADGVNRYKAFLSKLQDHANQLDSRFGGAREQLLTRTKGLRWSTRAQVAEYEARTA